MNANPKFLNATAHVDEAAVQPLPNSRKVYVEGSRPDIRVPMREITQSDTPASFGAEKNPPIFVYDTSGPYTDPQAKIDIRNGLPALRAKWIDERGDTEELAGPTFALRRRAAATTRNWPNCVSTCKRKPRRARAGMNVSADALCETGIVTPEMEFIAIRENLRRENTSNRSRRPARRAPSSPS